MNRYIVTGHRPVEGAAPGEALEHEFSAEEEHELVRLGRIEIVPRQYRVCGPKRVHDTEPGLTFEAALSLFEEQTLIEGGHIERLSDGASKPAPAAAGQSKGRRAKGK